MKRVITCILSMFIFTVTSAYAGSGHYHGPTTTKKRLPIEKEQAIQTASNVVFALISEEKVDPSWKNVKNAEAIKKDRQYGPEWVVSFKNLNVEDLSKQTLYVFLAIDGQYLGANYSGN